MLGDRVVLMTARPGRVSQVFPVELGRPRGLEIRGSPAYGVLLEKIWSQLREEVVRAMGDDRGGVSCGDAGCAAHWIASSRPSRCSSPGRSASAAGLLREAFFPRPSTILSHLCRLAADGTLLGHTLGRR